jgi:hypothetical protein
MQRRMSAFLGLTGLILVQLNGASNLGVPAVPGTRVPESNPATAVPAPQSAAPSSRLGSAGGSSTTPSAGASQGPAYSFGVAPAPVVSPGR